jgi:hypothetical protein
MVSQNISFFAPRRELRAKIVTNFFCVVHGNGWWNQRTIVGTIMTARVGGSDVKGAARGEREREATTSMLRFSIGVASIDLLRERRSRLRRSHGC